MWMALMLLAFGDLNTHERFFRLSSFGNAA
jgi:hypothetical protein